MKLQSMTLGSLSLIALAMGAAPAAQAASMDDTRFYGGVGYGQYSFEFDNDELDTDFDDDAGMIEGYIGTQLNDYWAFELGYHNFDEVSDVDQSAELDGVSLSTKIAYPITERFKIYATGGWLEWEAELMAKIDDTTIASTSSDGGDVFYGAGIQYAFTEHVRTNLEYERYDIDEDINPKMDVISLSVDYVF